MYDCSCKGKVYVPVIRNILHIPSTHYNLMQPFKMRVGGVTSNDVSKIQCEDLIADDHSASFEHSHLWILLQLNCALS